MADHTIAIEGSTYAGSVALLCGATVIAERTLADSGIPAKGGRTEMMLPSVAACLGDCGIGVRDLARIVCGSGPGGFTSLRVAASVAKGLACGAGIPLYAVPSLLLTVAAAPEVPSPGRYLAIATAMRGQVFALAIDVAPGAVIRPIGEPLLFPESEAAHEAERMNAEIAGPGRRHALHPHARGVARILDWIVDSGPCNIDTWQPSYGRLAEAQVRWEAQHGRALTPSG
ncbi:MAG: tRNA (adenosine(37)-N6)-threonylcarbamoyltransferase complex dimerization subunit type 1 TsaB [Gemmatimonadaceae bacterium]|nr:tRNA (adenosine(37)-N6)-threonylcarbamoyltransferase complex dimerization subunit type 1 TsaB [Gemmatimonadaceae bacterium]